MKKILNKIWLEILIWNRAFFPFIVLFFIIFALLEEFYPCFFTFYFSSFWVFLPVILTISLSFLDKNNNNLNNIKDIKLSKKDIKFNFILYFIFLIIFSGIIIYKTKELILPLKIIVFLLSFCFFALFSFAILFPDEKFQLRVLQFFKEKSIKRKIIITFVFAFIILIFSALSILLYWAIFDPFKLNDFFNKIYF